MLSCARAARRTCAFAGAASYGVGRASRASGLHGQLGARRAGGGSAPQNLAQPLLAGFPRVGAWQSVAAQVSAGGACGPRPLTAGLNDRHARAKPLSRAALPPCSKPRWPPGVTARASTRRCPLLDARATAPSGGLFSEVKAHSLLPLQGCPRRGLSSKLEAHALTSRRHTLPRGLLPPWWRPPRSSTSGTGSRPTSIY